MQDNIKRFFFLQRYNDAQLAIQKELEKNANDPQLLYALFLTYNGNYINIDFNDIQEINIYYSALDFANKRQKERFESEFYLYKALSVSPNLRKIFRFIEMDNYDAVLSLFELMDDERLIFDNCIDINEFYNSLDFIVSSNIKAVNVDLYLILVNLLYIKTRDDECLALIENLSRNAVELNSVLKNYSISNTIIELSKKLHMALNDVDVSNSIKEVKRYLLKGEFDTAYQLIETVLLKEPENIYAYIYTAMCKNKINKIEELYKIPNLNSNVDFLMAYKFADEQFRNELDVHIQNSYMYLDYIKGISFMKREMHFEALDAFTKCIDFIDSAELYNKCFEDILFEANTLELKGKLEESLHLLKRLNEYNTVENDILRVTNELSHTKYLMAYDIASNARDSDDYMTAVSILEEIRDYSSANELIDIFTAKAMDSKKRELKGELFEKTSHIAPKISSGLILLLTIFIFICSIFPSHILDNVIVISTYIAAISVASLNLLCRNVKPIYRVIPTLYFVQVVFIVSQYQLLYKSYEFSDIYSPIIMIYFSLFVYSLALILSSSMVRRKFDFPYLFLILFGLIYNLIYINCPPNTYYHYLSYIGILAVMLLTKDKDNHGQVMITSFMLLLFGNFFNSKLGYLTFDFNFALGIDLLAIIITLSLIYKKGDCNRDAGLFIIFTYGLYLVKLIMTGLLISFVVIIGPGEFYNNVTQSLGRISFMGVNLYILLVAINFYIITKIIFKMVYFKKSLLITNFVFTKVVASFFIVLNLLILYRTVGIIFNYSNFESFLFGIYQRGSLWRLFDSLVIDVTMLFSVISMISFSYLYFITSRRLIFLE